ncbi:MAG: hypothetical protein AAGD06_16100 [Acidobacteriota bacterium]
MLVEAVPLDGIASESVGLPYLGTGAERVVEGSNVPVGRALLDDAVHPHNVRNMSTDGLGLDLGVASIQDNTTDVPAEHQKEFPETFTIHQLEAIVFFLKDETLFGGSVATEVYESRFEI